MSEHKAKELQKGLGFKKTILEFFQRKSSSSFLVPFFVISMLILLVYANAFGNDFVWDDVDSIKDSPILHSIDNLPKIWSESMNLIYRPLVYSTYTFIYELFGGKPFFFHAYNIFIHISVSFLVFVLFRKFFDQRIALLITLFFSVHPANVEAVTWISAYSELSYVLFGIISLLFVVQFAEEKKSFLSLIMSSVFLFLGFLSKESTLIFSLLSVLYLFLFVRKKTLWGVLAMGVPTALYFYIRFFAIQGVFYSQYEKFIVPIQNVPLFERVLHIPSILWFYIKTFFFPVSLHIEQYWVHENFGFENFILPLIFVTVFIIILVAISLKVRRVNSDLFKLCILFIGGLALWALMHIQILPLTMTVAERWMYGAGIFILAIVGIVLTALEKNSYFKTVVIFLLMLLILLSVRTIIRNKDWKNNMTLYSHDYEIDPNYALANNYGSELFNAGRREEAIVYLEESIQLKPDWWRNWTNRGVYFEQKGEIEKAVISYERSIENNPGYVIPYIRLGSIYLFSQDLNTAEEYITRGLSYSPNNIDLLKVYAFILYGSKKKDEALVVIKKAYQLDPSSTNKELLRAIFHGEKIQINK